MARPNCFRLFLQVVRLAASRTFCTAGRSRPINTPMMAMTTSSSMSVKPRRQRTEDRVMRFPLVHGMRVMRPGTPALQEGRVGLCRGAEFNGICLSQTSIQISLTARRGQCRLADREAVAVREDQVQGLAVRTHPLGREAARLARADIPGRHV